ncbi:MAG: MBL fold metallo-hydrolase [Desulfobacterales bacterium]|nr:MBL fold metallo-hydrolase [Desulfobacterales bacterium]
MKIINLAEGHKTYTSNAYLISGDYNKPDDVNALIDTGRDPIIIENLLKMPKGIGKTRVGRVVITHAHYDHKELLPQIKEMFNPTVYAYSTESGCDKTLKNGDSIRLGDSTFKVLHIGGHSEDSIGLYCEKEGVFFSGDAPMKIMSSRNDYVDEEKFLNVLFYLACNRLDTIYPGHGPPISNKSHSWIIESLLCVKQGQALQEIEMEGSRGENYQEVRW